MRLPEYLSPSSLSKWERDQEEYYKHYLSDNRMPRSKQTEAMSVGSAFDSVVKSYLHIAIYGNEGEFSKEELFEKQVEPHNRDFAWEAGEICFEAYKKTGALSDLLTLLHKSDIQPQFESTIKREVKGVTLLGKPDIFFSIEERLVIYDWKVNGYCSKKGMIPSRGYIMIRDSWDSKDHKESRGNNCPHKDSHPMMVNGIMVNVGEKMETINAKWALQLSVYAWLLNEPIGGDFLIGIDQLACRNGKIRVAKHRNYVGADFQLNAFYRFLNLWEIIHSDHIFRDLDISESAARCELLDIVNNNNNNSNNNTWFKEACSGRKW